MCDPGLARSRGRKSSSEACCWGSDFAHMKTNMRARKRRKKKGWRKNDREASKPNSLLQTFAESWMCHASAEMHYWMGMKELLTTSLQSASNNHCTWEPLWGDPEAALPGFHSAKSWTLPTMLPNHHFTLPSTPSHPNFAFQPLSTLTS